MEAGERHPRKRTLSWRWRVARAAAVLAVLLVVLAACSERFFFYPGGSGFDTPDGIEDVWFENDRGQRLHGWFIPPADAGPGPWPAVLHVHGNAGNLTHHKPFCAWLAEEHGYAVLMFDYRSYGKSESGRLTRDAVLADAHAALDTLLARPDVDPDRVAVFGFSLGGATSIRLMGERAEPAALVAAAPFSDWQDVAGDHVPLLGPLLVRSGGAPLDAITRVGDRPVLLVHGDADGIVRPYHTGRLEAAAGGAGVPVTREVFGGLDHNELLLDAQPREAISAFLSDRVGSPTTSEAGR